MTQSGITRVLVVDDTASVRGLYERWLQREGMKVVVAADGVAGLALARAQQPDLVVSDIEMPRMDGVELCRALRDDPVTTHLPIVIVTGERGAQASAAIAAGCDVVLEKPCSAATLLTAIQTVLARRRETT